ncbi:MAG: cytochrome b/b6 domain-containing protein [Pseudomonadota bacterium]
MDHLRYRTPARLLHWVMALLILLTVPAGLIMVQSGIGRSLQNALFIYHKNVGVLLLMLVVLRLFVRWRNPPPPRTGAIPLWQERIAVTTHRLLYALLLVLPIAGYIRVRAGGFPIESLDALGVPLLVPLSDELADSAKALHRLAGLALIPLVALHVGAALYHGMIKRDGVFARMWPPLGR